MARMQAYPIEIPSGKVVIFDPICCLGDSLPEHRDSIVAFEHPHVTRDGDYKVYSDGEAYFVDVHPRILRAKSRPSLQLLDQTVSVDCSAIAFGDLHCLRFAEKPETGIVIIEVPPGTYKAWFEQKDDNFFRGVIGFGKSPKMIVNGEHAGMVVDLEKRAVTIFKREPGWKDNKSELERDILLLHQDGCKDKRMRKLADALGVKLPRKKPNQAFDT